MQKINNNPKHRRGQAAFEFMSTYGWVMIVLMSALAALVYFMPNFRGITPEKCTFGSMTPCMGARLTSENLTFVLLNGLNQNIYNISVNTTLPRTITCDVNATTLRANQKVMVTCDNTGGGSLQLTSDSRIKAQIMYKKSVDGYYHTVNGDIYAKFR